MSAPLVPTLLPDDPRLVRSATGLLAAFNEAGVLEAADVHVASRVCRLAGEDDERVALAVALAVRAARSGAVCLDLDEAEAAIEPTRGSDAEPLAWPEPGPWRQAVERSALLTEKVVRLDAGLLYLDRHWQEEAQVCTDLLGRLAPAAFDDDLLAAALPRVFPASGWEEQQAASEHAVRRLTTIMTGGPGTGKTAAVARLVALVAEQIEARSGRAARVALAAPTGKAAARLQESIAHAAGDLAEVDRARLQDLRASTVHGLLGWRPDSRTRFRYQRGNPLPFDLVVVDEVSMVSLSQMARLLEALRPSTRLVLVGDPDQLASVEAGAVLADLVQGFAGRPDSPVMPLRHTHRTKDSAGGPHLDRIAAALRSGDADLVVQLLGSAPDVVTWIDPGDHERVLELRHRLADRALGVARQAMEFDVDRSAAGSELLRSIEAHRLLCAHREGPYGVATWNRDLETLLAERSGLSVYQEWYPGRPVLVTTNDRGLGLANGDIGVVVREQGRLRVLIRAGAQERLFPPSRLSGLETVYAMTIHKSQGSEAAEVTVVLPEADSPLLTRELLYTALTRAKERIVVVGSEESVREAVARRVVRASGLAGRLQRS